jgi:hypothetical protein
MCSTPTMRIIPRELTTYEFHTCARCEYNRWKPHMRRILLAVSAILLCWLATGPGRSADGQQKRWYKGNLHTHTLNSDGDSTPADVVSWYREHHYNFLVLSDHNYLTEVEPLNGIFGAKENFLLVSGEEVTDSYMGKSIHVNAYNLKELVRPTHGSTLVDTLRGNVRAILAKGALPSVNHPNFRWSLTANDLLEVEEITHVEVYNGHPEVNNRGGGDFDSLDEMWDALLTRGRRVYGVAVDDAHKFKTFDRDLSNPGRGWVMVRAESLDAENITNALRNGDFYASTGVTLSEISNSRDELKVAIKANPALKYVTYFIGEQGKVLAKSVELNAVYRMSDREKYVRARVEASNGDTAWTQPVFR